MYIHIHPSVFPFWEIFGLPKADILGKSPFNKNHCQMAITGASGASNVSDGKSSKARCVV